KSGIEVVPTTDPTGAEFVIRPSVQWLEPGYYIVISSGASQVKMTVQITSGDGTVLDEILLEHGTSGALTTPAIGTRLRQDAEGLGRKLGRYLVYRATGKE